MSTLSSAGSSSLLEDQLKQSSLSSKDKANRLSKKADRLIGKFKRLREQADQLERKEKRIRGDVTEAIRLHHSLDFDALCLALRRNDSSTTVIEGSNKFPHGYAQQLGHALDNNKHVSSIAICLDNSVPVVLADGNSSDESLGNYHEGAKKFVAPLVKFLQKSTSLRYVSIHASSPYGSHRMTDRIGECFLEACLQNRNVEELVVRHVDTISARTLACCPPQSSLKKLTIAFLTPEDYTAQDRHTIRNVFRNLSSLSSLDLQCHDLDLVESILSSLRTHDAVEELTLDMYGQGGEPRFWSTLSALLHSSSQMVHLALACAHFDLQSMQALINCLKRPNASSVSTTVRELSLTDCQSENDARRLLVDFMQTRVAPVDTLDRPSLLQKFTITSFESSETDWTPEEIVSMLCMQQDLSNSSSSSSTQVPAAKSGGKCEPCYYNTIGSQIESLSLGPIDLEYSGVFEIMAEHAHLIRLPTFIVSTINEDNDVAALANCISKVESLRTVDIGCLSPSARPILDSLRANGTIESASIEYYGSTKDITAKLARAYAERNQHLDGLLLESSTCSERHSANDHDGGANPLAAGPVEPCNCTSNNKKAFGPTLWAAAQQAPRTEASKLLRSFLSLRESVGYK